MTENISQEHIKILSTPNAGVPGENSPYYRKLISAGYKGYLQGTVGGATLYGVMGAAIGVIAGLALLAINPALGIAAFSGAPFLAGYGVLKGADTFGNIGSSAAQLAEFAETNERRRALLDRLSETPSLEEAKEIHKLLVNDGDEKKPTSLFKWKTALAGAAIGAAIAIALTTLATTTPLTVPLIGYFAQSIGIAATISLSGILGAATGSMIGLDRYYVRKWMDGAEIAMNDQSRYEEISNVREHEVSKLSSIAREDEAKRAHGNISHSHTIPTTRIYSADYQQRVAEALKHSPVV